MAKKLGHAVIMLMLLALGIWSFQDLFIGLDQAHNINTGITSDLSELNDNVTSTVRTDLETTVVGKVDVSGNFEPEGDTEYSSAIGDANAAANIKTKNIFQNFMTLISEKLNIPSPIQWGIISIVVIIIVFMLARTILGDTRI